MAEFGDSIDREPGAFRAKFRKMAASPFAFYRGSACLFYADLSGELADDAFLDDLTRRVWIHGDLHAENFGTYMNSSGRLVFNVNDFDEAYVGPYIWDLKRFVASVALIGYAKALSDDVISELVREFARSYLHELTAIAHGGDDAIGSLTLETTTGVLHRVLQTARLNTRVSLLDEETTIENFERRFAVADSRHPVDDATRDAVLARLRGIPGHSAGAAQPDRTPRQGRRPAPRHRDRVGGAAVVQPAARRGTRRRWRTTSSCT